MRLPKRACRELGPLPEQVRLGDFWIPQRRLFTFGQADFQSPVAAAEAEGASRTSEYAADTRIA
jgi:hypothetical protein